MQYYIDRDSERVSMAQAKEDYRVWFALYPEILNPSDPDCQTRWDYAGIIGFTRYHAMRKARKAGHDWTRLEYWSNKTTD